ncbi:cilia- and flagella-associated protein 53 [Epinephelus fuscoguttatus]|uniref:cilia- and flagella-associated protein 53 n=1 Tax=Epinephelus fuscoguttatus TaxID=293821 RepID=UPI0020D1ABEF|nr:cilia- and flagella-associated protein 53 [Epinephelus fuscoguttatus]
MLLSQRRTRCREITGPTPHSVAVRAKFPSQRPADQLILDRQKQDAARDKVLDFAKSQRSCDIKTSWLKSSERRFLTGTIERQVRAALDQQKIHVDERRDSNCLSHLSVPTCVSPPPVTHLSPVLSLQQQQMQQLQQQRQQQTTLQQQQGRRRQLDQCLRLKMKRLAREQQDELQLDMNILQTLLQQETDDKQEAAHKKAELREEQRRYRQYLSEELQKQRREEEETEQLMEEKLKEVWAKREEQSRLQREARNRLMEEVMEARRLQIQHKLDLNTQKQAELSAERDELNRVMEEMKLMEEEDRRCQKQSSEAYQADLKAQIEAQQWRHSEQRAQEEREQQQGVILQQLYEQRKDHILSRPTSHASAPHPFRRTEGCTRSASRQRHTGSACAAPRYSDGLYE